MTDFEIHCAARPHPGRGTRVAPAPAVASGMRQIAIALATMPVTRRAPRRPGRPPIHLSASLNLVLPSQFFPAFRGEGTVTGEQRLMLAVLQDAIGIVLKHGGRTDARSRRLFAETVDWIVSDDVESPFAFRNVCESLGLDPSCLRRGLARCRQLRRARS